MIEELFHAVPYVREERLESEERERKYREEEERRVRRQELIRKERRRIFELTENTSDYILACNIRSYAATIEAKPDVSAEEKEWIVWVREKADWIDLTIRKEDTILGKFSHSYLTQQQETIRQWWLFPFLLIIGRLHHILRLWHYSCMPQQRDLFDTQKFSAPKTGIWLYRKEGVSDTAVSRILKQIPLSYGVDCTVYTDNQDSLGAWLRLKKAVSAYEGGLLILSSLKDIGRTIGGVADEVEWIKEKGLDKKQCVAVT